MEIKEAILSALQEVIFPEIQDLKKGQSEIRGRLEGLHSQLEGIHKRLDDQTTHLADQSRRLDEQTRRLDELRQDLTTRLDQVDRDLN